MKILLIDNYDSFTYNLYHYLSSLKANVDVIRNDKITSKEIVKNNAAIMVKERDLNRLFYASFDKLVNDDSFSKRLSQSIKKLAKPNATKEIIKKIKKILKC